jgi:NADH-quinone oxidoreductase subunit L
MEGPTPVSALIHAATMVAAGVYLVARTMPLFAISGLEGSQPLMIVGLIGAFTALFASTIAIAQNDIKRVLAYSTISQLGYMIMALGVGGFVAAIFHLLTHAFFKALLFLGSGSVIIGIERGHHHAEAAHAPAGSAPGGHDAHDAHAAPAAHAFDPNDMMNYGGLLGKMPATGWTFIIGALALSGIFPLAGFWSKDEILAHAFEGGLQHGAWLAALIYFVGTFAAFLTAFYTGRQIGLTFAGKPRHAAAEQAKESPATMTFPLIVLALFTIVLGAMNLPANVVPGMDTLHKLIGGVFAQTEIEGVAEFEATGFNIIVAGVSTVVAALGFVLGFMMYRRHPAGAPDPLASMPGYHFLKNKWYVDEFYRKTVVGWSYALAEFSSKFDRNVVDGMVNTIGEAGRQMAFDLRDAIDTYLIEGVVNGAGRLAMRGGQALRGLQTGRVQNYLSIAIIGLVILASYRLVGGTWEIMLAGAALFGFVGLGAYVFSRASK